jgi:hypothetical protein
MSRDVFEILLELLLDARGRSLGVEFAKEFMHALWFCESEEFLITCPYWDLNP